MDVSSSVLIARIAGLLYLSVAAGCLFRKDYFKEILKDFSGNPTLVYFSGFIALILGSLIIHTHNRWQANWTVLITLIGWLALLKGILLLAFPDFLRIVGPVFLLRSFHRLIPWFCTVAGLFFLYFGFFA